MSQQSLGEALVGVFNRVFQAADATILCGGLLSLITNPAHPQLSIFAKILIAVPYTRSRIGVSRVPAQGLPDYGYWYAPDGRNAEQQSAFYSVEVKPQAIEALFCEALDLTLR